MEDQKNSWTPADHAAFEVDWAEFLEERPQRDREIVGMLAKGYRRNEAAEAVGISRPAVTEMINRLRSEWQEYRGENQPRAGAFFCAERQEQED